jgi:pyruvate/2-oxoacid:ferredoxin oxidoreductase beta subunit
MISHTQQHTHKSKRTSAAPPSKQSKATSKTLDVLKEYNRNRLQKKKYYDRAAKQAAATRAAFEKRLQMMATHREQRLQLLATRREQEAARRVQDAVRRVEDELFMQQLAAHDAQRP